MDLSRDLAAVAAEDLVEAMRIGLWEPLSRVPALWRRGGATRRIEITEQLERTAAELRAAGVALPEVRAAQEAAWADRLYGLLTERPRAADRLYQIITEIGERRAGLPPPPPTGDESTDPRTEMRPLRADPDADPDAAEPEQDEPAAADLDAAEPEQDGATADPEQDEPEPDEPAVGFMRSNWILLTLLAAIIVVLTGTLVTVVITLRPGARTAATPVPRAAEVTLRAVTDTNGVPSRAALDQARSLLVDRLTMAGLGPARVKTRYDRGELVIGLADVPDDETLRGLVGPGRVSFRRVLTALPAVAPPSGLPSPPDRRNAGADSHTRQVRADAVRQKLGPAYDLAAQLTSEYEQTKRLPDVVERWDSRLEPFARLAPDDVEVLPVLMQLVVPTVTCAQLNRRPTSVVDEHERLVACDQPPYGQYKYLLDVATVTGPEVRTASAERYGGPDEWIVHIGLSESAQPRFTALTAEAVKEQGQIAITADQLVLSAPQVQAVIVGEIQFGPTDRMRAQRIAALTKHHDLPLAFDLVKIGRR